MEKIKSGDCCIRKAKKEEWEEAMKLAKEILGKESVTVTAIPDGISVIVK